MKGEKQTKLGRRRVWDRKSEPVNNKIIEVCNCILVSQQKDRKICTLETNHRQTHEEKRDNCVDPVTSRHKSAA